MNIKIYDWDNCESAVNIPVESVEEIEAIFIQVLSGDETGQVVLKNGNIIPFDASDCRIFGFDDGSYCVRGSKIKEWLNFSPPKDETISYARQAEFL